MSEWNEMAENDWRNYVPLPVCYGKCCPLKVHQWKPILTDLVRKGANLRQSQVGVHCATEVEYGEDKIGHMMMISSTKTPNMAVMNRQVRSCYAERITVSNVGGWFGRALGAATVSGRDAAGAGSGFGRNAAKILAHTGYHHRFNLLPQSSNKQIDNNVPELQVGCADGSVDVRPQVKQDAVVDDEVSIEFLKNSVNARHKRQANTLRDRRDYISWYGSQNTNVQHTQKPQSFQTYQLASPLPYYVPIWGNPRRIPVFFPAKPILFNPGYPVKNRPAVNRPTGDVPVTGDGTRITIGTRIGEDDDKPVWGIVESDQPVSAAQPPRRLQTPPLIHRPSMTESTASSQIAGQTIVQEIRPNFSPPMTTSPPPPSSATQGPGRANTAGPDRCVWAIISCCNPASQEIRYNCFERLGCQGAFWDDSPCRREVTLAALDAAQKYYN
ncbi:hadley [Carabus blaptoides fortunei]